jgi:hypothetical protein
MKTLILAYDNQDFKDASKEAALACVVPHDQLIGLIEYAKHDYQKGFCKSFQIYKETGELIYTTTTKGNPMDKREAIHLIIDELLNIEESSKKSVSFSYSTILDFDFHVKESTALASDRIGRTFYNIYTRFPKTIKEQYDAALIALNEIKHTPDVEPKVSFTMTRIEAERLGLLPVVENVSL